MTVTACNCVGHKRFSIENRSAASATGLAKETECSHLIHFAAILKP